jgi:hypothetical protein
MLRGHIIKNELFAPLNDTLDHIQRQHAQRVQNIDTFIQEGRLDLICWVDLSQDILQLMDLGKTGFSGYYCADCWLYWGFLMLEVLDLFYEDVAELLRWKTVDTVEENRTMVVWDKVSFPCLKKFFFQMVDNVCWDQQRCWLLCLRCDCIVLTTGRHRRHTNLGFWFLALRVSDLLGL